MQKICLLIKIVYIGVRIYINLMMCTVGINEYSRIRNTVKGVRESE